MKYFHMHTLIICTSKNVLKGFLFVGWHLSNVGSGLCVIDKGFWHQCNSSGHRGKELGREHQSEASEAS